MPRPCSVDLRARVIGAAQAGASRREVAERFDLTASAVINWVKRELPKRARRWTRPQGMFDPTRLASLVLR